MIDQQPDDALQAVKGPVLYLLVFNAGIILTTLAGDMTYLIASAVNLGFVIAGLSAFRSDPHAY